MWLLIIVGGFILYWIFGPGKNIPQATTPKPVIDESPVVKELEKVSDVKIGAGTPSKGNI